MTFFLPTWTIYMFYALAVITTKIYFFLKKKKPGIYF